ncbi:MAG: hypothetical protein Q7S40_28735 [Opitutaceae bacterium]|nr:hypothetical protein [Opitutaceae bacterium]
MQKNIQRIVAAFTPVLLHLAAVGHAQIVNPAPASTAPSPATTETVELSPFVVEAQSSDSYDATNTNSVTGTNLSLNKTPLDAKIFNRTMMDELGVVDIAQMLSDFGGLGGPLFGAADEGQRGAQEGDPVDYKTMSSRGLTISNPRRDGFLRSDTSLMDSFDVESAEALQGSNSLLFGSGDAGGVVNVTGKRARLNQRSATFSAKVDSEGSRRFTADINAGTKRFGVRINGVKGEEKYFRPILGLKQEGLQLAATVRPWRWLSAYGELRHYVRDNIRAASATLRTPVNLLLTTGETMDNKSARYSVGFGGSELLGNAVTLTNMDSMSGAHTRHYYIVRSYSGTIEAAAGRDLHFQLRYGNDWRVNKNLSGSNVVLYHPDAPGNLYRDANGALLHEWAMNIQQSASPNTLEAQGYKLTGVYRRNLGRWGDHWVNAFVSQQDTSTLVQAFRFLEIDASGNYVSSGPVTATNSGRKTLPAAWVPAFPETIFGRKWPTDTLVHPTNELTYKWGPLTYPGAAPPTAGNPLGVSGPVNAVTGAPGNYSRDETSERSRAISVTSEFWGGRINTMAGFRFESADTAAEDTGEKRGPIDYDSTTVGVVFDTPIKGIRGYTSYATNAKINFTADRDIFNQSLPIGRGVSREAGLKFAMWDHRLSGNISYYISEARNFIGSLGGIRDDVDPDGINGRNGGSGYTYSRKSDGIDLLLSMRPLTAWQVTLNYSEANGSERSNVSLPVLYNDEFNTTTAGSQTVVGVKNATTGAVTPLMVPSIPADPNSPRTALSLGMMRDSNSPYFAVLDPDSGQILNASTLGLTADGVGTGRTSLPISDHQVGFTPASPTIIVRRSGEMTAGYPEHSFSVINRFQFREGRLRGMVLGLASIYQNGFRGYMYTDATRGGERRMFYRPDRIEHRFFGTYGFKPGRRIRATVQVNISNLFDRQTVITLPNSTTGAVRYFAYQYSPRKFALTTSLSF